MSRTRNIHKDQLPLFDDIAGQGGLPTLSRRQIEEQIIRKETELTHGEQDFSRHFLSKKALHAAAQVKHSNRAKVDGVWMDVRFCRYLLNFLNGWQRRRAQLEWEIAELRKLL